MSDQSEFAPPGDEFLRHRWLSASEVEWVKQADRIMVEHGAVRGRTGYEKRHEARWRARKLIRLMVELRLHERWELREHVERQRGSDYWKWSVEYLGQRNRAGGPAAANGGAP